jgi:hypothetical protein
LPAFQALKPVALYDQNCTASNAACGTLPERLRHHGLPAPSSAAVCPAGPVRNGDAGNSGPAIGPSTILDRAQRYGQICPTTITADVAPGSGCPRLRPPRRAALPMLAVMFVVASAPPWAAAIIVSASSPAAAARAAGCQTSSMVFCPGRALHRYAMAVSRSSASNALDRTHANDNPKP